MSDTGKAVFLSYASQDAEAARRICEALRSAGMEVWFDAEGGLEHGDEWDAKIRRQIKECVLFIPVISANTEAREEGYFRIEWDLAAERARGIASGVAFILPVVVDATREQEALVPERFRAVQWTRLPGGDVPSDVLQRFAKLWSHRTGALKHAAGGSRAAVERPATEVEPLENSPVRARKAPRFLWPAVAALAALSSVAAFWLLRSRDETAPSTVRPVVAAPMRPLQSESDARTLMARARALYVERLDTSRDDCALAEDLLKQAQAKDPNDAEVRASISQLHSYLRVRGWDLSNERREAARAAAQRAMRLDPTSFEARIAEAYLLADTGQEAPEKERLLRALRGERPADKRVLRALATVLDRRGDLAEADALSDEAAALPGGDPLALYNKSLRHWFAGNTARAEAAIIAALEQEPNFTGALMMSAWYATILHGDVDRARATINRIPAAEMREDRPAYFAYFIELLARQPDAAIARLHAMPRSWFSDAWYRGPKATLVGEALHAGGRNAAAAVEWRAALRQVEEALREAPNNQTHLFQRALLLAKLGERAEAEAQLRILLERIGATQATDAALPSWVATLLIAVGHHEEAIAQISRGLRRERRAVDYTAATLRLDPLFDPLRGRPEFAALIAEAEAIERAAQEQGRPSGDAGFAAKSDIKPALADKSVAVLAFANLSDDKANEYFSDGISEELLNVLAKVPGLKVSARTSAFHFKGKNVPIPEIARQLGVAYVVEGSVRKQGDRVRITAQLIKAVDGFHVWSDTFTRELKDVFAVQDEIAGLVAQQLQLKLSPSPRIVPINPEAMELYLQARQAWGTRTDEGLATAEAALNRAIALAPEFARAHAALVDVWMVREQVGLSRYGDRHHPAFSRMEAALDRALQLEPGLAEAYAARGSLRWNQWRFSEAEQDLEKAVALNPNYATAHHWIGRLYQSLGRVDEALAAMERAARLDPLSTRVADNRAFLLVRTRSMEEALAEVDRALTLQPENVQARRFRAVILAEMGRAAEAGTVARELIALGDREADFATYALARIGAREEAERQLAVKRTNHSAIFRAGAEAALGRYDACLESLRPDGVSILNADFIYFSPVFDPLREDGRFHAILGQLGLAEAHARAQVWRAANSPRQAEVNR